ncbi:MAG: HK97 family phage prohead protease [Propioniciclava sp.]|uniref:HK97 family phage prohead protease n=1 Tax=Propioniciclava sp. TaxID=2038686 RepID=UPI0039E37B63
MTPSLYLTASQAPTPVTPSSVTPDATPARDVPPSPTPAGTASEVAPVSVTLSLQSDLTLDTTARTLSGIILPYGVIAQRTSMGAVRFAAGSIRHHPDLKRIKLLIDHDRTRAVGYATAIEQDEDGVRATFHVPAGDAGDEALAKAANGIRDGLSIGANLTMHHRGADGVITEVTEAALDEVSLVSLPAFTDSRVCTVRASQQAHNPAPAPAIAPAPYTPEQPAIMTAAQATQAIATALTAGGKAAQVTAALADIVPANDAGHGFIGRPSWLNELWTADNTDTPIVDALSKGDLTSTKVQGWKWNIKPQVAPYTGNKAEIPTGPISTIPAEATAKRLAGGWDVDRIYLDLGDGSFITSVFTAATADFKRKLEAAAATELRTSATVVAPSASLTEALGKLGTVAGQLGSSLNVIAMAPDVWAAFTNLVPDEVPWWLQRQGEINLGTNSGTAGGLKFAVNHGLPAGQVLAFDARAAKLHQPKSGPVKVQALDLAHGGVDLGVYGYYALQVHDARAILLTTITG